VGLCGHACRSHLPLMTHGGQAPPACVAVSPSGSGRQGRQGSRIPSKLVATSSSSESAIKVWSRARTHARVLLLAAAVL
jgi:hypothetical protein